MDDATVPAESTLAVLVKADEQRRIPNDVKQPHLRNSVQAHADARDQDDYDQAPLDAAFVSDARHAPPPTDTVCVQSATPS